MNAPAPRASASRRLAWGLASLVVAGALGCLWLDHYGALLVLPQSGHAGWIAVGLLCLLLELPVRVLRTAMLLRPPVRARVLLRPILAAHAMDLLGPPLAGDVGEVVFVGRAAECGAASALHTLLLRMTLTVAALCLMAAGATAHLQPVGALALAVLGVALARFAHLLMIPIGRFLRPGDPPPHRLEDRRLPGHLGLALAEVLLPGLALVALAAGLGDPMPIWLGLATVAGLELLTYVPMPLGGIGLQHWGMVGLIGWLAPESPTPALLAVAWHGALLLVAGVGGVVALAMGTRHD